MKRKTKAKKTKRPATKTKRPAKSRRPIPVAESDGPYQIGKPYLIRTVTHYYTGRLKAIFQQELLLEDAAWIADTGRYYKALESGELSEVEPIIGPCVIGRGAVIDAVQWPNNIPLPRSAK